MRKLTRDRLTIAALAFAVAGLANPPGVSAQDAPPPINRDVEYSPYVREDFPNRVLFGDTHLHTAYSADAGLVGATTTPDDAYRFAKGETVVSSNGLPARLQRPLDWLVVTDHAENLGIPIALEEGNPALQQNEWGRTLAETFAPRTEVLSLGAIKGLNTAEPTVQFSRQQVSVGAIRSSYWPACKCEGQLSFQLPRACS